MPSFISPTFSDFAVALLGDCRLATASQLARHPEFSWRTQPSRRLKEWMRGHRDLFERLDGAPGTESRYRLTKAARRRYGVHTKAISALTQRANHWLGLTDIWLEMAFSGGRPSEWRAEVDRQFDAMCRWRGRLLLIEYQRTPITSAAWTKKWEVRKRWYKAQTWTEHPTILLVDVTGQLDETVQAPRGTVHVRRVEDTHHALTKTR